MKNLSYGIAACLVAMFLLSVSVAFGGEPNKLTFKLKAEVLKSHKADIMVFAWDNKSKEWLKVVDKDHKKNLTMYLNPEVHYQVWFTSKEGVTKILYIDAGDPGVWYEEVSIDFDNKKDLYARFYQKNWNYGYTMETVPRIYRPRGLIVQR